MNAISRHALEQFSPQMICLEGFSRETLWPFPNVLEILQMLVMARARNDATRCGPCRELHFTIAVEEFSSRDDVGRTVVVDNVFFLNVPEILQMHATDQEFNYASKYGPYCELFFFLMRRETDPTEAVPPRHVSNESLAFFAQPNAQHSAGNDHWSGEALASSQQRLRSSGPNGPGAGSACPPRTGFGRAPFRTSD